MSKSCFMEPCAARQLSGTFEFLCVDEQLFPLKGRCGFKQYIPTKPQALPSLLL
ncbi:hypothetical protein RvY_03675 [Ramazzottius varieornatus]|uniref:PiggyBac transposable element-derived protein domain-containing protein n=1 Tax=Ramazzottius varieornatus TaxID=947166 RepID=A0A1D1UW18_RAMVA|nr:hypothetical protein RvY_03675 [Ramazzottius varieornatus]